MGSLCKGWGIDGEKCWKSEEQKKIWKANSAEMNSGQETSAW